MKKVHISDKDSKNDENNFFTKALNETNQAVPESSQKAVENQDHDQGLEKKQAATSTRRNAEGKLSQSCFPVTFRKGSWKGSDICRKFRKKVPPVFGKFFISKSLTDLITTSNPLKKNLLSKSNRGDHLSFFETQLFKNLKF